MARPLPSPPPHLPDRPVTWRQVSPRRQAARCPGAVVLLCRSTQLYLIPAISSRNRIMVATFTPMIPAVYHAGVVQVSI
jgi:hypothetical protein